MNIKNLKKIKSKSKLRDRIKTITTQLLYYSSKLKTAPEDKLLFWGEKIRIEEEKLKYITSILNPVEPSITKKPSNKKSPKKKSAKSAKK